MKKLILILMVSLVLSCTASKETRIVEKEKTEQTENRDESHVLFLMFCTLILSAQYIVLKNE